MTAVVIVAQFIGTGPSANDRFSDLSRILAKKGLSVELVTSSFSHQLKEQKSGGFHSSLGTGVVLVPEPGYAANISTARLHSHRVLSRNVRRHLMRRKTPHVVYCATPSLSVAEAVARYSRRHGVRFILDVQDLWPDAFRMVLPKSRLTDTFLLPMARKAERIYRAADTVVTVSDTYSNRVADIRGCRDNVHTVYLGTDLARFDAFAATSRSGRQQTKSLRLGYIGTLGASYDLPLVFEALDLLRKSGGPRMSMLVMGSGPREGQFRAHAQRLQLDVEFTGRLEYPDMVRQLIECDVALNPIVRGSAGSVINKVCDYAAAGLPVVNTQESAEYRQLIARFDAGINSETGDASSLAEALFQLASDTPGRLRMGRNSRRLAETLFDRSVTYETIVREIIR